MKQQGNKKTKSLKISEDLHTKLKVYCAKGKDNIGEVVESAILAKISNPKK